MYIDLDLVCLDLDLLCTCVACVVLPYRKLRHCNANR